MRRNWIAVGIVLLALGLTGQTWASPFEEGRWSSSLGKILYVGGSGPGNYSVIQDAVDAASVGDTVFVYHGIYSDYFPGYQACVMITKSIQLVGEDKTTTIINGTQWQRVVIIEADGVSVSGFTLQNGGTPEFGGPFGAGIDISRNQDIHITGNIFTRNKLGVLIEADSSDVTISKNVFEGNYEGVETMGMNSDIRIHNNVISNNTEGLFLSPENDSVENNTISDNAIGLVANGGDASSVVSMNQIQDNGVGMQLANTRLTVAKNNFINNTRQVDIRKGTMLLASPLLLIVRQHWRSNYWSNWEKTTPKPILGKGDLDIPVFIGGGLHYFPLIYFPFVEFDWHPVPAPYTIPATSQYGTS